MLAMNALVRNPPALTPTLSRREKELYRGVFNIPQSVPSPSGEGWGEGWRVTHKRIHVEH